MLYYIFEYLDKVLNVPGTGVFQYITFRSALAVIMSLLISTVFGKRIINYLRNKQIGETVRELAPCGAGTGTERIGDDDHNGTSGPRRARHGDRVVTDAGHHRPATRVQSCESDNRSERIP